MSLEEYVENNIGKKIRDGQCVALARDYAETCHEIPHTGGVVGAIDIWLSRHTNPKILQYFTIVEGRPEPGDWILFSPTATNKFGHIAVVLEDRGDGFNVFESDGFRPDAGSKRGFWTWSRYAGALRPIKS